MAKGMFIDTTSAGSHAMTSLADLARAVRESGVVFDVINLDTCLMGMFEVAYEFRGAADYLIFSDVMWGCGDTTGTMEQACGPGLVPDGAADAFQQPGMSCTSLCNGSGNRQAHQGGASSEAESSNLFGLDLYACLKVRKGNLLFSPSSISTALTMLCAGAGGQTRREMASVLRLHRREGGLHGPVPLPGPELVHHDSSWLARDRPRPVGAGGERISQRVSGSFAALSWSRRVRGGFFHRSWAGPGKNQCLGSRADPGNDHRASG